MTKKKYDPQIIQQALAVKFESMDLNCNITIREWLKKLLRKLLIEQEGFSGKRPFGNSDWQNEPEVALVKAGILKGKLDEDGYLISCEQSTPLFLAMVDAL